MTSRLSASFGTKRRASRTADREDAIPPHACHHPRPGGRASSRARKAVQHLGLDWPWGSERARGFENDHAVAGRVIPPGVALFPQKPDKLSKTPREGSGGGLYVRLVRIDSGMNNKKARVRTSPASLIFSAVWGFDSASTTCGRRKRKELATLYAAYASFLTH